MTLLTTVRDVCAVVGVAAPTSVFASINSNRTMFEMLACANEMAQRIAYDTRDWTTLITSATLLGDGVTTAFNLPANYKRMLLTTDVWRSTTEFTGGSPTSVVDTQPMRFVSDTNEWIRRRGANETNTWGEWTMFGGFMHIFPVLVDPNDAHPYHPGRQTASFTYLDRNSIALASGGYGDTFMADADTFRLDERLLKLGMIFEWKKNKGSPYAENLGEYSDAIANVMGRDKPSPIIIGRSNYSDARIAYYGQVPYP